MLSSAIRQQAGSYRERKWLFVFVGACLQAIGGGQSASLHAANRRQTGSYMGIFLSL
jgi:hypothetical protein